MFRRPAVRVTTMPEGNDREHDGHHRQAMVLAVRMRLPVAHGEIVLTPGRGRQGSEPFDDDVEIIEVNLGDSTFRRTMEKAISINRPWGVLMVGSAGSTRTCRALHPRRPPNRPQVSTGGLRSSVQQW